MDNLSNAVELAESIIKGKKLIYYPDEFCYCKGEDVHCLDCEGEGFYEGDPVLLPKFEETLEEVADYVQVDFIEQSILEEREVDPMILLRFLIDVIQYEHSKKVY